jgi:hypothetical protein
MKGTLRLPEIPLALNPATPEGRAAVGFKWAAGNVGRRHKIAGRPTGFKRQTSRPARTASR